MTREAWTNFASTARSLAGKPAVSTLSSTCAKRADIFFSDAASGAVSKASDNKALVSIEQRLSGAAALRVKARVVSPLA